MKSVSEDLFRSIPIENGGNTINPQPSNDNNKYF